MAAVMPLSPHPFIARAPRELDMLLPHDGMMVDLSEPMHTVADGIGVTHLADGGLEIDFEPERGALGANDSLDADQHDANLAEFISPSERQRVATELIEGIESDLAARKEWYHRLGKGMELLGITTGDINLGVFKVAETITHPIIAEAVVQFQARAISELFPPDGPAKTLVLGRRTREREQQAERVKDFMNYSLMFKDRPYFTETDQMLFMLGLEGSEFRKAFRDPITKQNVARWVRPEDFIVPYSATSLETAPRYTHVLHETHNDLLKKQRNHYYRQVEIQLPTSLDTGGVEQPLVDAKERAEGVDTTSVRPEDIEHAVYEVHCELDIQHFEDLDELGEPTGIALPYVVVIEKDSQEVLAIYRNWREEDALRQKRIWFTHYKYLPGTGFYGFGLLHMLGGLGAAATGVLRAILVTAAFAGAGGGFKSKDTKIAGSVTIKPGVYTDTEHTYEELSKAFYTPPFKEPPQALFNVLGHLVDAGHRFASTTEVTVGDAKNTGPVGTTIALIEQGQKVFSGIHKRCHMALGVELQMLAELHGEYLPDDGAYPFDVPGETKHVFRTDFDDRVDIVPVSDPNISSNMQRIAIAQTCAELADRAPDIYDRRVAHRRLIEALRVPDADELIVDRQKVQRADPLSENALAIAGRPIRVYEDQDHDAHAIVHAAVMRDPNVPEQAKALMAAHVAEHLAQKMRVTVSKAMGIPPVPVDFDAEPGKPAAMQLPPQIENQIAARAAAAINKIMPPPKDPKQIQAEGDIAIKRMRAQAEIKLDSAKAMHKMALERKVAFGKLALDREMGVRRLQQDGQHDRAKIEQDRLNEDQARIDGQVGDTEQKLEQAVIELAQAVHALAGDVQQLKGEAGGRQAQ